jgi:1,4-alpha-glucan branching enzyme
VFCRTGVAAFARDTESSQQVWSAREGYPGDPHYRDFYRDIGFDLPMDYIGPYVHPEGHRVYTGIKYHAITHDKLHDKWVYDPEVARRRASTPPSANRQRQVEQSLRTGPSADRGEPLRRRAAATGGSKAPSS